MKKIMPALIGIAVGVFVGFCPAVSPVDEKPLDLSELEASLDVQSAVKDLTLERRVAAVLPATAVIVLLFLLAGKNGRFLLLLIFLAGQASALQFTSKKAFVEANIPAGGTLKKLTVTLTGEQKAALSKKRGVSGLEDQYAFIIGRTPEGAVIGAVCFVTLYATEHKCVHHMGFAFSPDGSLREIAMVEAFCDYVFKCASRSFLGQFDKKQALPLKLNEEINAVTGATLSSAVILDAVRAVTAVFLEYVKKP